MTRFSELPKEEHPVERLMKNGPTVLSDAELIAVLLGTQSMEQPHQIIRGGLPEFARRDWVMAGKPRIRRTHAARIAAALELSRRIAAEPSFDGKEISSAHDVAGGLVARYGRCTQEHFVCVFLTSRNTVICERVIFVGTLTNALVSAREPLRMALELHAAGIIACHCHPSGSLEPSREDRDFTRELNDACRVMGVTLMDHVIVTATKYVSMKSRGFVF